VPDKAKALVFAVGGKQVYAARKNLPTVTICVKRNRSLAATLFPREN
jgi:hypothetical protein